MMGTGTVDFKREVEEALASLPRQLRDVISNVVILVDEEPAARASRCLGSTRAFP
jgi:predicted Zn-dependent protease with MMP-like domain